MKYSFLQLQEYLRKLYAHNPYVTFLDMNIVKLEPGLARLDMPVDASRHTNLYNVAHGGALASLADTAMGVACATTGKKVVTLDLNMNFIKAAGPQETISAVGRILHNGKSTMVVEVDITDSDGSLVLKGRGTFFVTGKFDPAE